MEGREERLLEPSLAVNVLAMYVLPKYLWSTLEAMMSASVVFTVYLTR